MVGLLGGSFDPIHHGHLIAAVTALETLGLEQVRLVPARQQPFKTGGHGASAEQRGVMVDLAIRGDARLAMEPVELGRQGPSYTVETLEELRQREPDREWCLLIGADAAREFESWHRAAEIPDLARLVVFSRAGSPAVTLNQADSLTVPAIDISATTIRARVARGQSIRYWVPPLVAEYIARNGLYAGNDG